MYEEYWTYPPFSATVDVDGRIFARGTQDMKSVGVQYLAAVRALQKDGVTLKRTVHIMFVPGTTRCGAVSFTSTDTCVRRTIFMLLSLPIDEEISGPFGLKEFVKTGDFRALNVGFSLDEGVASPTDDFAVFYAERAIWRKCVHRIDRHATFV